MPPVPERSHDHHRRPAGPRGTGACHDQHLQALGVVPGVLSAAEREVLDRDGYLIMPGLIDPTWLKQLRAVFDAWLRHQYHGIPDAAQGDRHLLDLVNAGSACDGVWTHPRLLAAVDHLLQRPFKLSSLNARDPRPGSGAQALHADWPEPCLDRRWQVVNSLWLLDDFLPDNGATRLVPGSQHRPRGPLTTDADGATGSHPDQIILQAPAGSVVVFNAHLLHGGTVNRSQQRRRVLHGYFTAREHPQQLDQRAHLRVATQQRLNAAGCWILDVDERPDAARPLFSSLRSRAVRDEPMGDDLPTVRCHHPLVRIVNGTGVSRLPHGG